MFTTNARPVIDDPRAASDAPAAPHRSSRGAAAFTCALVVFSGSGTLFAAPPQYHLTDLGTLGGTTSVGQDVNELSEVAGWSTNASGQARAFLWRNLQMIDLGVLPGQSSSYAYALNNFGDVTGSSGTRGFVWRDGAMIQLPTLPGGGGVYPTDINDAGVVVGYTYDSGNNQVGFRWDSIAQPASLVVLPPPTGLSQHAARAINNSSEIANDGFGSSGPREGWRYSSIYGYRYVPGLGGNTLCYGINERGWMTGMRSDSAGNSTGFVWNNSTSVNVINPLSGYTGQVNYALLRSGDAVGRSDRLVGFFDYEYEASIYIRSENRNYALEDHVHNLDGWQLKSAYSIGVGGMIAGFGTNGVSTANRAFLLTPIPADGLLFLPDSLARDIYVLDPNNGSVIDTIDIGWTSQAIELIDGNGTDLLLSDRVADTIWRLNPNGSNAGQFVTAPVDDVRGIAKSLGGYIVGSSAGGFRAWQSSGVEVPTSLAGDLWDVELLDLPSVKRYLISDVRSGHDNIKSYDLDLNFRGQTLAGGMDFPEQIELMTGTRFAVASHSSGRVHIFNLRTGIEISSFPVNGLPRGVFQISDVELLVSTTSGLYHYYTTGNLIRQILTGGSLRYLSQCRNFNP